MKIIVSNRDELFCIRICDIAYIQADDHYSSIYMMNGTKQMVSFGLSQFCEIVSAQVDFDKLFIRINRSFIVGVTNIYSISITKGIVTFSNSGGQLKLALPKTALRDVSNHVRNTTHEEAIKIHEE